MNGASAVLPALTLNRLFVSDLMAANAPCFAMGYVEVEEHQSVSGFLALRPHEAIPSVSTDQGFRFGHCVLGVGGSPVLQFTFEFYGHALFHALVNPGSPIVQAVLSTMVETKDYFFFAINPDQQVTAFRSHLETDNLAGLHTNLENFGRVTCLPAQYEKVCRAFAGNPQPPGQILDWVCRDNPDYLDLTRHRLALNPR
jgi:hypothetical protein